MVPLTTATKTTEASNAITARSLRSFAASTALLFVWVMASSMAGVGWFP